MSRRMATSCTCSCSSHVWFTSFFESHTDLRMSPIVVSETTAGDCCEEWRDVDIARHPDRSNRLFFVSAETWDRPQTKTVSWFSFDSVIGELITNAVRHHDDAGERQVPEASAIAQVPFKCPRPFSNLPWRRIKIEVKNLAKG